MSQEKTLRDSPAAQNHSSLLVQARLASRQAKRVVKAAERREKSDALKEEGNAFFRNGHFQDALERYQQAIDVHGPSRKPVLLANLAATYIKLGRYPEAEDAADRALTADPKSVKARYRRGMARKHMEMWTAAEIDFRILLTLEPGNKEAEAQLAFVEEQRDPLYLDEGDAHTYSSDEAPALEDDPQLGESLSESSDCEHTGNGVPCRFYNRTKCKNGHACRFSHAPDGKSERDALGRNVCRYYLIGVCKFGERCSYLHSNEYLLQKGWWSTAEGVDREKKRYKFTQMWNKAIVDYENQTKPAATRQASKSKRPKGKKNRGLKGSEPASATTRNESVQPQSTSGMRKNRKKPAVYSYPSWEGCDSYGDDENDMENGMCGFTGSEVDELISLGVKPWDDDAWDVLNAFHSDY